MSLNRRDTIKLVSVALAGIAVPKAAGAQDLIADKIPMRIPLDEFVKDGDLLNALRRGVRAMKRRAPSDPLSWFYQAAIHGVTENMVKIAAVRDPNIANVDQKKVWNQCPHFGQESANFLPWHRAYTHHFERILRAHTGEPRFSLPYWDYSRPENYRFPREFGISTLDQPLDGDTTNPLHHSERNIYFTDWEHWSGNNLPYSQLTPEAVDWTPAREATVFFGKTERDGLGGAVYDTDTSTRGRLESFPHDPIHRLVGGLIPQPPLPNPDDPANPIEQPATAGGMAFPPTAGFDPIFCVHHSNLDRLWVEWSCMPGKTWGDFPQQAWFDEKPWTFFDIKVENGVLMPVEVMRPRKQYFDHRALGIAFKSEDLGKTPLALPDPIPAPAPTPPQTLLLASVAASSRVSGILPERIAVAPAAAQLQLTIDRLKGAVPPTRPQRILMRVTNVNLDTVNATGFDVHLVASTNVKPKRSDPSFVGSIALFRHDGHAGSGPSHHGHGRATTKRPSDTFDVTDALAAAGATDPARMQVIVVPYSLSATVDGQKAILETQALRFDGIEFF